MSFETAVETGLGLLRLVRQEQNAIGVALSFGKDSLLTLDLCCRVFDRVEAYYLYRVADMRVIREWSLEIKKRFGVTVRPYPHFDLVRTFRHGVLMPHWPEVRNVPTVKMLDIENFFRSEAKVDWLAMGWRRNDSYSRAMIMKQCAGWDPKAKRVFPLRAFSRAFVMRYLDVRNIKRPPTLGRQEQGGLDFHPAALTWLRAHYPDDYAKWCTAFPFTEAWRRSQIAQEATRQTLASESTEKGAKSPGNAVSTIRRASRTRQNRAESTIQPASVREDVQTADRQAGVSLAQPASNLAPSLVPALD